MALMEIGCVEEFLRQFRVLSNLKLFGKLAKKTVNAGCDYASKSAESIPVT